MNGLDVALQDVDQGRLLGGADLRQQKSAGLHLLRDLDLGQPFPPQSRFQRLEEIRCAPRGRTKDRPWRLPAPPVDGPPDSPPLPSPRPSRIPARSSTGQSPSLGSLQSSLHVTPPQDERLRLARFPGAGRPMAAAVPATTTRIPTRALACLDATTGWAEPPSLPPPSLHRLQTNPPHEDPQHPVVDQPDTGRKKRAIRGDLHEVGAAGVDSRQGGGQAERPRRQLGRQHGAAVDAQGELHRGLAEVGAGDLQGEGGGSPERGCRGGEDEGSGGSGGPTAGGFLGVPAGEQGAVGGGGSQVRAGDAGGLPAQAAVREGIGGARAGAAPRAARALACRRRSRGQPAASPGRRRSSRRSSRSWPGSSR